MWNMPGVMCPVEEGRVAPRAGELGLLPPSPEMLAAWGWGNEVMGSGWTLGVF